MREIARTLEHIDAHRGTLKAGFQYEQFPSGLVEVSDVSGGMVLGFPRDKTPGNSFYRVRNGRTRDDEHGLHVGRRPGTILFGGAVPDANPVTKLVTYFDDHGNAYLLRISSAGIWTRRNDAWYQLVGLVPGVENRVSSAQVFGDLYLMPRQGKLLRIQGLTGEEVTDAPRGAFIAGFGDRLLVANIVQGSIGPTTIAWSANADPTDWSDISSGQETLLQGSADFSDEITGLHALEGGLLILRRRSIWVGERQPFAQAPFRFRPIVSGEGCDLPYTSVNVHGGVIYADQRTRGVYFASLASRPQRISDSVTPELYDDIVKLTFAEGAYDPWNQEYHLGISTDPASKWITKVWVYSLRHKAWSYDDSPNISTLGEVTTPQNIIAIDDLIGNIDAQVGTIDELGGAIPLARSLLFKGGITGEVIQQTSAATTDHDGSAYEFELISQNLGRPAIERTMTRVGLTAYIDVDATAIMDGSKDLATWKFVKNFTLPARAGSTLMNYPKPLTGRDLYWRLRSSVGDIRIAGYWANMIEKGEAEHT